MTSVMRKLLVLDLLILIGTLIIIAVDVKGLGMSYTGALLHVLSGIAEIPLRAFINVLNYTLEAVAYIVHILVRVVV